MEEKKLMAGKSKPDHIYVDIECGYLEFFPETKSVFPFTGWPMMCITKEEGMADFYVEFQSNEEIDEVIKALEAIKYKNNQKEQQP